MELYINPQYEETLNYVNSFLSSDFDSCSFEILKQGFNISAWQINAMLGDLQFSLDDLDFSIRNEECTVEEGNAMKKILIDNYQKPALELKHALDVLPEDLFSKYQHVPQDADNLIYEQTVFYNKPKTEFSDEDEWKREEDRLNAEAERHVDLLKKYIALAEATGYNWVIDDAKFKVFLLTGDQSWLPG